MTTTNRRLRLTQPEETPTPGSTTSAQPFWTRPSHPRRTPHALPARRLRSAPARPGKPSKTRPLATARRGRPSPRPRHDLGSDRPATRPHRPGHRAPLPTRHPQGGLTMHPGGLPIFPAPAASSTCRTAAGVKAERRSPAGLGLNAGEDRRTLTMAGATTQITYIMPRSARVDDMRHFAACDVSTPLSRRLRRTSALCRTNPAASSLAGRSGRSGGSSWLGSSIRQPPRVARRKRAAR